MEKSIRILTGYVPLHARPYACRIMNGGCSCGLCDGICVDIPGHIEETIHYADGSTVQYHRGYDGKLRSIEINAPSGDRCF